MDTLFSYIYFICSVSASFVAVDVIVVVNVVYDDEVNVGVVGWRVLM